MVYFFYYVPVGINAELRRAPILTYAYAGLCVLVFVIQKYFADQFPFDLEQLAYYPDSPGLVTAVAATFLHVGYLHLIGNALYLVLFGRYVEDRMGRAVFSAVFFGCAAAGNVLQGFFNAHVLHSPGLGVAGASGAVSGLLGAFTVRFLMNKLQVAYWVFMPLQAFTRGGKVEIPVIFAVAFWFLFEFLRSLLQTGGYGTQVAYVAHVSGFLLGAMSAVVAGHFAEGRSEALLRRANRYMQKGEAFAAQGEYIRYLEDHPCDPDARAGLARAMALTGDAAGAYENYRAACEMLLDEKRRGDCETLYQEAVRGMEDFSLGPEHHLGLAFGLERNLKPRLAARAYETFAGKYPDHGESAFVLLRAALIHFNSFSNLERAASLYDRLLREYPDDAWADYAREQRRKLSWAAGCGRE
jgi:membrane associated rhomboid family serine protease